MSIAKKMFITTVIGLVLVQAVVPVSLIDTVSAANAATSTTQYFTTRAARIKIQNDFTVESKQTVSKARTMQYALALYVTNTIGPVCESQFKTQITEQAIATSATKTARVGAEPIYNTQGLSNEEVNRATLTPVAPVCEKITDAMKSDFNSEEVEKIYTSFFSTFAPSISYATYKQAIDNKTIETYLDGIVTTDMLYAMQQYITTNQLPSSTVCTLSAQDQTVYDAARKQYTTAVDQKDAFTASSSFATMQSIQARAVCPTGAEVVKTVTSECATKVSIMESQIALLDPVQNQQEIQSIKRSIQQVAADPACTTKTRAQKTTVANQIALGKETLSFQTAASSLPNATPEFCANTAFVLKQQLGTASLPTLGRLVTMIDSIDLPTETRGLASMVKGLAIEEYAIKQQSLGINNPSTSLRKFISAIETVVQAVLSNQAAYKFIDGFSVFGRYVDVLDNNIGSMTELQTMLQEGRRYVWDAYKGLFEEQKTTTPGFVITAPATENDASNNMEVQIKQLAATKYTELVNQPAYSMSIGEGPTLQQLTELYFGSDDMYGSNNPYLNQMFNRVRYEIAQSDLDNLPDAIYVLLQRNSSKYPTWAPSSFGIEVFDVNGKLIAVIPDHDTRTLVYMPEGRYTSYGTVIQVGEAGEATVGYTSTWTYPQAIDATMSINGILEAAIQGSITWPENIAPITQDDSKSNVLNVQSDAPIGLLAEDVRITRGESIINGDGTYYAGKVNTPTVAAQTAKREDMVPTAVNATVYFNPHTLTVNATRTIISPTTNRIDFTATLKGGTLCGITIEGSITYKANSYGIYNGDGSPILSANVSLSVNGYKLAISSDQLLQLADEISQAKTNNQALNYFDLINRLVNNQLSVLGTPFGSLRAAEQGLMIDYIPSSFESEDVIALGMEAFNRLDMGRLSPIMDQLNGGGKGSYDDGGKGSDKSPPAVYYPIVNYNASQDTDTFIITYDVDGSVVFVDQDPQLEVTICEGEGKGQTCTNYSYAMSSDAMGSYTAIIDPTHNALASRISAWTYYQGQYIQSSIR